MIQITPQMRILLASEPTDFRRGIDGLSRLCREVFQADPFSGAMFVFWNRQASALKCLVYDGQGFWLCQKRLSTGKFRFIPKAAGERKKELAAHELQLLLWNGDPAGAKAQPPWRRVATAS